MQPPPPSLAGGEQAKGMGSRLEGLGNLDGRGLALARQQKTQAAARCLTLGNLPQSAEKHERGFGDERSLDVSKEMVLRACAPKYDSRANCGAGELSRTNERLPLECLIDEEGGI